MCDADVCTMKRSLQHEVAKSEQLLNADGNISWVAQWPVPGASVWRAVAGVSPRSLGHRKAPGHIMRKLTRIPYCRILTAIIVIIHKRNNL